VTLDEFGTSCELVKFMLATPLLVNMLVGTPEPSIEMTIGKGPAPLGVVIVELKVIEVDPCVTTTLSMPPEKVAVSVAGGAPFGPVPQYWMSALISARRQRHWSRVVMRVPLIIKNGSGRFAIAVSALKAGGVGAAGQSAPVFSTV
jgi:hypothetical protein